MDNNIFIFFLTFIIIIVLANGIRILREYERAVVFFLGRFYKVKGPGLIIIIPILQQMVKVTKRTIVLDVPPQDLISKDNISVRVNAVVYFRVEKPELAINNVEDYYEATSQLSQTTLRSILGQHDLDEMLSERDKLNKSLQTILDKQTDKWGIKVAAVEIKDNSSLKNLLIQQIESRVRWRESVLYMIDNGVKQFIEIGPGKVLSGLIKRIDRSVKISAINNEEDINIIKI